MSFSSSESLSIASRQSFECPPEEPSRCLGYPNKHRREEVFSFVSGYFKIHRLKPTDCAIKVLEVRNGRFILLVKTWFPFFLTQFFLTQKGTQCDVDAGLAASRLTGNRKKVCSLGLYR